eukprot:37340_1
MADGTEEAPPSYPALDNTSAPPAYADVSAQQQPVQIVQPVQPSYVAGTTQVVYVQQQVPQDGAPTTTTNGGQTTTVVVTQPMNVQQQAVTLVGEFKNLFRLKIQDPRQNCACECCSLWIAAHVWLILYIIGNIYEIYIYTVIVEIGGSDYLWIYAFLGWSIIDCFVNFYCFYGLYNCAANAILAQIAVNCVNWVILLVMMILFGDYSLILSMLLTFWATWVFWKIWKWAKYFENGGAYDANMLFPPAT